jgi:hypothetical protein
MGSGSSKIDNISRSFNETLTENIKQTMITKSSQFGATMGATQRLSITDVACQGNINIADIQQKVVMQYNFSQIDKMMDASQLDQMMSNAVQKTLDSKTDVKSEFAASGGGVDQSNIDETFNKNVQRLITSVDMNYFTSVMADMAANQDAVFNRFTSRTGNCDISNIKQDIAMDVAAAQLAEKVTDEFVKIMGENEAASATKQTTTVSSTGLLGDMGRGIANITSSLFAGVGGIVQTATQPMIVLGILLMVIVIAWVIARTFTSGKLAETKEFSARPQPPKDGLTPPNTGSPTPPQAPMQKAPVAAPQVSAPAVAQANLPAYLPAASQLANGVNNMLSKAPAASSLPPPGVVNSPPPSAPPLEKPNPVVQGQYMKL